MPYPGFFQKYDEASLRSQIDWAIKKLGFDIDFYESYLSIDRDRFQRWRLDEADLTDFQRNLLKELWTLSLHLYSYCDYSEENFHKFFSNIHEYSHQQSYSTFTPPWAGQSIYQYTASGHLQAIKKVYEWLDAVLSGKIYSCNLGNQKSLLFK